MNTTNVIIDRLIECREKAGLSKRETAKRIGVTQPSYVRYENGTRIPSIQVVKEIAKVFNTSAEYLTGASDSPEVNTYIVERKNNPHLFDIIQIYNHAEENQQNRLYAYAQKLFKNEI